MKEKVDDFLISVIIPAYNAEKYIATTIEMVQRQTYTDWELQVVADGCERTMEIMDHYQDPRIVVTLINALKRRGQQLRAGAD